MTLKKNQGKNTASVKEVIKFKHMLNEFIRYKGFDAIEVEEMKKISADEWACAKNKYNDWKKTTMSRVNRALYSTFALGLGSLIISVIFEAWRPFGIAMLFICCGGYFMTKELDDGFFEGFEHGYDAAINKMLEIDDEEAVATKKRANEMELDEPLIQHFDETDT